MAPIMGHSIFGSNVMACAQHRGVLYKNEADWMKFMEGNLLVDLSLANKKITHFYVPSECKWFEVPNMETAKRLLRDPSDPVKMGVYSHLYLDYYWITKFLLEEFHCNTENGTISRESYTWKIEDFWEAMYRGYTETNPSFFRDRLVNTDMLNKLPDVLSEVSGSELNFFNIRREKSWRQELMGYLFEALEGKTPYTGEVFEYDHMKAFFDGLTEKFVEEEVIAIL